MGEIQILQVTQSELSRLISESLKSELEAILQNKEQAVSTEEKELMTRKETAELLQVSLVTIHEWTKTRILTHYKMGNRTYYKRSEVLNKLFNSNTSDK